MKNLNRAIVIAAVVVICSAILSLLSCVWSIPTALQNCMKVVEWMATVLFFVVLSKQTAWGDLRRPLRVILFALLLQIVSNIVLLIMPSTAGAIETSLLLSMFSIVWFVGLFMLARALPKGAAVRRMAWVYLLPPAGNLIFVGFGMIHCASGAVFLLLGYQLLTLAIEVLFYFAFFRSATEQ